MKRSNPAAQPAPSVSGAYTVAKFCEAYGISDSHLYKLISQGLGPRTFKAGRRTLISRSAADEWQAKMERRAAEEAAA